MAAIRSRCTKGIGFTAWKAPRAGTFGPQQPQPRKRPSVPQTTPLVSANDAVVAEVNKQRAATRAFTEQTASLNQKLAELAEVVGQTQEIAKQNPRFETRSVGFARAPRRT